MAVSTQKASSFQSDETCASTRVFWIVQDQRKRAIRSRRRLSCFFSPPFSSFRSDISRFVVFEQTSVVETPTHPSTLSLSYADSRRFPVCSGPACRPSLQIRDIFSFFFN